MSQSIQNEKAVAASDLCIAIPCFNEAAVIGRVLDELEAALPEAEILVVDDGSIDGSRDIIRQHPRVRLLEHDRNRGYGASIRTACLQAGREWILWYDGDGQHRPEMIEVVLPYARAYDCVIGARSSSSRLDWRRQAGRRVLLWVAQVLTRTRIPDLNSGLRVFRLATLKRYLHLLPDGFSASTTTTMLMLERGYRVRWIPITTGARTGRSSVRLLRDGWATLMLILHLVILFNPLRFFMPLSLGLCFAGLVYGVVRAILGGLGIPAAAVVVILLGVQAFFFGLLADQISAIRKERYEDMPDD
ncbi:MAG: glycosyltransferase family 2 protein [Pirellulales bacterium]|nr:glycosyltransferase family 2 protein [Pirellulales bacterium]